MIATRYVVRGRVQGVGFRWFVQTAARALALRGWVRNLADGSVEVVAGGTSESLATLEARLRDGPPSARVTSVEASPTSTPMGAHFEVR